MDPILSPSSSPQNEYGHAINFHEDKTNKSQDETSKIKRMMANVLRVANESKYIYPSVALVVTSILVIFMLFQHISIGIKIFAVLILLLFIAYTVYEFKR